MSKPKEKQANGNIFNDLWFGIIRFFRDNAGILVGLAVIAVVISIINSDFLSTQNLLNVLRQVSTNMFIAIGMTLVIILAGIDLSVGSIMALAGVVTGGLIAFNGVPIWVAVFAGLLIGVIFGLINGYFTAYKFMPAFIVTLATMNIARGAAYVYTDGKPIRVMSDEFNFIGSGYVGLIPVPVIYMLVIVVIVSLIMNRTKLGRYMYAVGGNIEAARYSGIDTKRVQLFAYTLSGFLAAFSGIVLASRMFSGQPTAGMGAELDAIAAVVLGGTSMAGGRGRIGGTVIGVLIIGVLSNGMNLMGINSFWQYIVKGIVILIAVYVDIVKKKNEEKA